MQFAHHHHGNQVAHSSKVAALKYTKQPVANLSFFFTYIYLLILIGGYAASLISRDGRNLVRNTMLDLGALRRNISFSFKLK